MKKETKYIDTILDAIYQEGKKFLTNYSEINIIDNQESKTKTSQEYKISLIDFNGDVTIKILLCIEEELFYFLFNQYFEVINEDEREELENALPDEIINIIVGLAIKSFPKELEDLILSVPYKLSLKEIQDTFLANITQTKKLITNNGSMIFTIIQE